MSFHRWNVFAILALGLALSGFQVQASTVTPAAVEHHNHSITATKKHVAAQMQAHRKALYHDFNGNKAAADKYAQKFGGDYAKAHVAYHGDNVTAASAHAQHH